MMNDSLTQDILLKAPEDVLSDPALLFLFYRIEQILGIKAGTQNLKDLNDYMEKTCGSSFIENPAAYEYLLTSREHVYEISKFITINETYFFREEGHFELLAELMPEFAKLNRQIQICSAACSIGCEAYSLAMLFDYHSKNGVNLDFAVDAFDVNKESIETAKNGRYTYNSFRNDGKNWSYILDSYLINNNSEYSVSDKIKRKVRFFPHNILRGIEKQYDIIFFRNALIYFSSKNRHSVLNYISDSLYTNGLLFLGISETSAIKHPLFSTEYSSNNIFYFKKISDPNAITVNSNINNNINTYTPIPIIKKQRTDKINEIPIHYPDIADILKPDDGKQNACFVLEMFNNNNQEVLFGSQIAAAVIYYLQIQEIDTADRILSYLEKHNTGACTKFLRGEYYSLLENHKEAEKYYQDASVKDKYFWPAFYRIAVLSADGNPTRYEYKIKKTIESINLAGSNYECFMGGFSSDYFLKILEKKLH